MKRFKLSHLADMNPVSCPCGTARRAFVEPDNPVASIHLVEIKKDAQTHYHKKMTEIYLVLEGEGHMELDGEMHPVKPLSTVLIQPGCRHRKRSEKPQMHADGHECRGKLLLPWVTSSRIPLSGIPNLVDCISLNTNFFLSVKSVVRIFGLVVLSTAATFPLAAEDIPPNGERIYANHCARCHGVNLDGEIAGSLIDGVWKFGDKASYARRNVKFGITDLGMPPFEDILTEKQIRAVIDFVREREKAVGARRPDPPSVIYTQDYVVRVEVLTDDLEIPWSIDFLDQETLLVTERPGNLVVFRSGIKGSEPVTGTPAVLHQGQGGLMDVAVDPDYRKNGWIYLSYSHSLEEPMAEGERPKSMTRMVRGRVKANRWVDEEVVYEAPQDTYLTTRHHYGCRIVFDPEGYLFFSIGDRGKSDHAQDLSRPNGKMHRIRADGSVPTDNPFVHLGDALPTIYSYGHRNPQGVAVHPDTGRIWLTEHGPLGGDELNLVAAGRNYGWPVISYGRNYDGTVITEFVARSGMEQPILYWKPSIAVCGLDFYGDDLFAKWRGKLLAGALKYEEVQLLTIEGDRVMHREVIVKNLGRVRDVAVGPDGAIYVVLNGPDMLVRLAPESLRN